MGVARFVEGRGLERFHYAMLAVCSSIYALTALDVMLIGSLMPAIMAEWGLGKASGGLLLSSTYIGMFMGAFSFGMLSDRIGRRGAMALALTLMSVFTAACSISWNFPSMFSFRILAGIGLGGALPLPGVYVSEYIPAKYRGRFLGLVETSWVYGALLALAFPFFIEPSLGWRASFLIGVAPAILLPFVFRLPESLRYLETKGLKEELGKVLKRYGVTVLPKVEERRKSLLESLRSLWSSKMWRRTLLLWILWASLVYTYHGMFIWLPTIYTELIEAKRLLTPLYYSLLVTLFQVPGYYSSTFLLDRIGRKKVLYIYLGLSGVGCLLFMLSTSITQALAFSAMISFFNLGAWAGLYAYTPELYPTEIRGTGSGFAAAMGRLAGILAPILTGYLWLFGGLGSAFFVFGAVHLLAALGVVLLGIETKGLTLEEISPRSI